jgi:hypothetical protein
MSRNEASAWYAAVTRNETPVAGFLRICQYWALQRQASCKKTNGKPCLCQAVTSSKHGDISHVSGLHSLFGG